MGNLSRTPRVLSIAGSDSGGGAGIQADLKAFAACGVHGMTAITAITAQNTLGVIDVQAIDPETIVAQVRAVATDIGVDAVKIGMLGSTVTIEAVARALDELAPGTPLVIDPVMVAESGARLLQPSARSALIELLLPRATVVTPNVPEARELATGAGPGASKGWEPARLARPVNAPGAPGAGPPPPARVPQPVGAAKVGASRPNDHAAPVEASFRSGSSSAASTPQPPPGDQESPWDLETADVPSLARAMHRLGPAFVVVTGGHREQPVDVFYDGTRLTEIPGERYAGAASHGSGCTHSSVLAARLAWGDDPLTAARRAKEMASHAVRDGLTDIGGGAGPVDVLGIGRHRRTA